MGVSRRYAGSGNSGRNKGPCVGLTVFLSLCPHRVHSPIFTRATGPRNGSLLAAQRSCTGQPWPVISDQIGGEKNSALPGLVPHSPIPQPKFPCSSNLTAGQGTIALLSLTVLFCSSAGSDGRKVRDIQRLSACPVPTPRQDGETSCAVMRPCLSSSHVHDVDRARVDSNCPFSRSKNRCTCVRSTLASSLRRLAGPPALSRVDMSIVSIFSNSQAPVAFRPPVLFQGIGEVGESTDSTR